MCDAPATSREHVPPKCIFPDDAHLRKNLIKVPSCDAHNLRKSKDDELLRHVLACAPANNDLALRVVERGVMPSWERRPHILETFLPNLTPLKFGDYVTASFTIDINRFEASIRAIVRGLFFADTNKKLLADLIVALTNAVQFPNLDGGGGGDGSGNGTKYKSITAVSASVDVQAGETVTIALQANCSDSYTAYYGNTTPEKGQFTSGIYATGAGGYAVDYTADSSASGPDSFSFVAVTSSGLSGGGTISDEGMISINIIPTPPPPPPPQEDPPQPFEVGSQTIELDSGTIPPGTSMVQTITLGASGGQTPYTFWFSETNVTVGSISGLGTDYSFTYTLESGKTDTDTISFTGQDAQGNYGPGTITFNVKYTDPTIHVQGTDVGGVIAGQTVPFTVTSSGGNRANISYTVEGSPQYGTATIDNNGNGYYTNNGYFPGYDSFTFSASDGSTTSVNIGTVTFTGASSDYPPEPGGPTDEPPNKKPCPCENQSAAGGGSVSTSTASAMSVYGMAAYRLDLFSAGIQISDFPLPYESPFGPTTTVSFQYNSVDVSENGIAGLAITVPELSVLNFSGLAHTHLGPRWRLNWAQFITDSPGQLGLVELNMAHGGSVKMPKISAELGTYGRNGVSADTIQRTGENTYAHWLSDGSWEEYTFVGAVALDGRRHLFLTRICDPQGNAAVLNWVAVPKGVQLTSITDASGKTTTFGYDDASDPLLLTKVTDPFGRVCTLQYSNTGDLWKLTDPVGIVSEFAYEAGGNAVVSSMATPYGTTTFSSGKLQKDGVLNGRFAQATKPAAAGTVEKTDRVESAIFADAMPVGDSVRPGFEGNWLSKYNSFYWTPQAHYMGTTVENAQIIRWAVDPYTHQPVEVPASIKLPLTNRQCFAFTGQPSNGYLGNSSGVATASQVQPSPDGVADSEVFTTQFTYNEKGKPLTVTDPQNRKTTFVYHENKLDVKEVHHISPDGQNDLIAALDGYVGGKPTVITSASGGSTNVQYNSHGQAVLVTDALNRKVFNTYDENDQSPSYGRLLTTTAAFQTPNAATTTFSYDAFGRLASVTDSDSDTVSFAYDQIGVDEHATLDRLTRTNYPDGSMEWVVWDKLDVGEHHEQRPNAPEHVTTYEHDANRKVTNVSYYPTGINNPASKTISYVQGNCCGSIDTLVDSAGNQTHWQYDVLGRKVAKFLNWNAGNGTQVAGYGFDAVGRLQWTQDARSNTKNYGYDAEGRLSSIQYTLQNSTMPTPPVTLSYEPVYGRLSMVGDGTGTTIYSYKQMNGAGAGAVASETKLLADGATQLYTFNYEYDVLGRRVSGPRVNSAQWDALGRLTSVANGLGVFTYAYQNLSGRLRQVDAALTDAAAALRTNFTYEQPDATSGLSRRLTGIVHQAGVDANSLSVFSQHSYQYDAQGRLSQWSRSSRDVAGQFQDAAWSLTHDGDDQLSTVEERDGGGNLARSFGYNYDPAGNRILASRNVVAAGENVSREWSVNALNQLTGETVGPESGTAFTYDADGNLLSDGTRTYEWDAENRLVAVNYGNGQRVEWSYDAFSRRVKQHDTGGDESVRDLIWEGMAIIESRDESSGEIRRYYGNGEERQTDPANPATILRLYYTTDHLGSIRELVDGDGTIRARYEYGPYGERTKLPGGDLDADFGYTGHYTHDASGTVLAPYRGYNPPTGRWLSRDPIEEEGGINLYGYVGNGPINAVDPLGLDTDIIVHRNPPDAGQQARDAAGTMSVFHNGRFQFSCPVNQYGYQTKDDGTQTHGIYPRTDYSVQPRTDADKYSNFKNGTPAVTAPGQSNPGDAGNGYHNVYIHPESNLEGGDSKGCLTVPKAAADRIKQLMDADQKAKQPTTLKVYNYGRDPSARPVR